MKKSYGQLSIIASAVLASTTTLAAQQIDLAHSTHSLLQQTQSSANTQAQSAYKQTAIHTDKNGTAHIRVQQTWAGYPIWGADAVVHIPHYPVTSAPLTALPMNTSVRMNGNAYIKLQNDLTQPAKSIFTTTAASTALQKAIEGYKQSTGTKPTINHQHIQPIVFVDDHNKAHWAWKIDFQTHTRKHPPAIPTMIMDGTTHQIYKQWDNLQTNATSGGGNGGNPQMGKLVYDGLNDHLPILAIDRDDRSDTCYLRNNDVIVKDRSDYNGDTVSEFTCHEQNKDHNGTYWDGNQNSANGGYSPDNDALFIGHVVQDMYNSWYGIPPLTQNGHPMKMVMRVHDYEYPENAFWDGEQMTFGDGGSSLYPFTILNIGAHEISHGFTEQHSNLIYEGQSGGLNESFSDMAGAAANYFAYGKNTWQLGAELSKSGDEVFRYMDIPSKDCDGRSPGHYCSIDRAGQYHDRLNVHFSSGVFNRAFYLLSNTADWNTRKAFDVMVKANQDYWVSTSTFQQAACGVINAAKDLHYDTVAVSKSLAEVDLDTEKC